MHRLRETIARWFDIPEDALGAPRVILSGRTQALIENAGAILEYTPDCLRVRVGGNEVTIKGERLQIRSYTGAALCVVGTVDSAELSQGGR
ncbi:MAG: YabP/YqfC family sporulation protein [Clostridiaceae bacterium]|nr:YabP/YqfC family sporulation protein [Clostridiaceae bacterium]